MSADRPVPIEVFISYSHKDERLRRALGAHLSLLKRQGIIDAWHDRRIVAGREWANAIDERLNTASIILLLVSADFLASDYCYEREMERALERHDARDARVIPVILRTTFWEGAPFARLEVLPENGRAITSWPDRDRAFTDVARGIHKAVQEILGGRSASTGERTQRLPPIWNVPSMRSPHFTGRDDLLEELHCKLGSGSVALTAVHGMGGIGKTQLALEYAYRHTGNFDLVWWLRAEEPSTLLVDYAGMARPLGLGLAHESEVAIVAHAVRRELSRREGWLLVFDNAKEPKEILHLFPDGNGRILVTSRHPTWPFATQIEVPTLSRTASVALLLARTQQRDREAANALAEELGDLPLALEQAAAYVHETSIALADYLKLFRSHRDVA